MKVAVVGLGLFGRALAVDLARAGAEVVAVDTDMALVEDVRDEVALAVCLDATDAKELRAQGIHKVDVLVASIGNDFEANQLLVVLAVELGIPRIVARAPSANHARILKLLGAHEVVLPEIEVAERMARSLLAGA
ncbi:MAG: TrkA family potassium uptake protein [Planctomycetota bacterium]|nr:TrkA family potassium uptake protein [Planctomycetota bacterium]